MEEVVFKKTTWGVNERKQPPVLFEAKALVRKLL